MGVLLKKGRKKAADSGGVLPLFLFVCLEFFWFFVLFFDFGFVYFCLVDF